ncbi:CheR family methyltransferase [Nodosilinea sp. AN01ver1]|uniref:CheR family methyltransferase n=1 Tax=Nodosilinea sp. AN01ver1 TaxID=3423362 RepID=UPI003D30FC7C
MDDLILKRISSLISRHSGIHIRDQDYSSLAEKVWRRAKSLRLTSLADYHTYLLKELENGLGSLVSPTAGAVPASEWQELYSILTVNESYFFRDSNQFRLLSERLLPDIISRKQAAAGPGARPSLRIWSAGCSTGEELYSIAIALDELNFPWDQWDTLLMGTDISKAAVDSARLGLYGSWSFRQTPADLQQKYFYAHHQVHQICDRLRQRVTFQNGNLLSDLSPASGLGHIDLIVCRNVFIYLDSQAIGQIIQKFHRALGLQGYLLTGHTELYGQDTSQFTTLSFPESVVYQKQPGLKPAPPQPAQAATIPSLEQRFAKRKACGMPETGTDSERVSVPESPSALKAKNPQTGPRSRAAPFQTQAQDLEKALQEAEALLDQEAYTGAIRRAEAILKAHPRCDAARKIAARAYANTGHHEQAKHLCLQVIRRHPLSLEMHYLLAQIAEDQNDLDGAKAHLRKIIYLDASFVRAYLDLASIYEREKQIEKTQKMRGHALMLLAKLPPDARLDHYSDTTVAQWQSHLNSKVASAES